MKDVIVELKQPFSYAAKGDTEEASFIYLFPPTVKQIDKMAPLKQAFVTAINDLSSDLDSTQEVEAEASGEITGPQIMAMMYRSSCNMASVFLHAQELFKSGAALVDGEVKLTIPLMEKMSVDDFEKAVGEYLANFTAPSLMDGL